MAAREETAWAEAVQRFGPLIRAVARRTLVGAPADAEDAAEEVFLELLGRESAVLLRYEGRAPLGAYLLIVARRVALRLREADRRRRLDDGAIKDLSRRLAGHGEPAFGQEDAAALQQALAALPPRQQQLLGALAAGRTPREVGEALGCAPGVVSTLAWRARVRLKRELRKSADSPR
jgi:RNA polymerase sigma factor (sigma-70 family)